MSELKSLEELVMEIALDEFAAEMVANQKELDEEFAVIVNEHFWNLVGEEE